MGKSLTYSTCQKTQFPIWQQSLELEIDSNDLLDNCLHVLCVNDDENRTILGSRDVHLKNLSYASELPRHTYRIFPPNAKQEDEDEPREEGHPALTLRITLTPKSQSSSADQKLLVTCSDAAGVTFRTYEGRKPDLLLAVALGDKEKKTRLKIQTDQPVWDQTLEFDVMSWSKDTTLMFSLKHVDDSCQVFTLL